MTLELVREEFHGRIFVMREVDSERSLVGLCVFIATTVSVPHI